MAKQTAKDYLDLLDQLEDENNISKETHNALMQYLKSIYHSDLENNYSEPMKWIGMYIAVASLACILAMGADLVYGLRTRKLWFPCRWFRINAFFITLMSIAMKLPVDLSGSMPGDVDQVAKLGSMAFMCTMMANLLPFLATMSTDALKSNLTALGILVITMAVNVCIQISTGVVSYKEDVQLIQEVSPKYDIKISKYRNTMLAATYVALLLLLLIIHVCSCLAILKSKKIIESKYQQRHVEPSPGELLTPDKLQEHVSNHWIMAGSGNPQFITACFRTTSASGVICLLVTILHTLTMSWTVKAIVEKDCDSDYKWSMIVIVIVQFIGVVIGTIAPLSRCFATLSFKVLSFKVILNHFKVFEVEGYWTSKLYHWKRASIKLPFRSHSLKVVIETFKRLILNICIDFQTGVVVVCKIIALIPFVFMICLKWLLKAMFSSPTENTQNLGRNNGLRPYVLQLEDEMELAERTLEGLSKSVDRLVEKGEKKRPTDLIQRIKDSASGDSTSGDSTSGDSTSGDSTSGFEGVVKFDQSNHHLPTLQSNVQYQDSWSLPVVTLTTIVIYLQETEDESLLKSVREGLKYVNTVEESLNVGDDYVSIRKEAETLWNEVDVEHKWLGNNYQVSSFHTKTARQIVEWLSDKAKTIVYENGGRNDDSIHRSICANSMYHITKTLLTYHGNIEDVSRKGLLDDLSSMIIDIIAACLTNLPQVITTKCHNSVIEKREASVKDAALLLGETKQIIETLQGRGIPDMNPNDLPFINKWRAHLEKP